MYPFLNCSDMNSCTSSLSSLDNRYTFPFLSTNPFFISIVLSHSFFMGTLSLDFLPKTYIHLWNLSGTSLFTSSSNFAASSPSSQTFYSFTTFFTSIILSFFCFFFSFFFYSFSSCFFPFFSFFSSLFCFSYPDFPYFGLHYFPHSSGHLIIFTSPILQSISEL